MSGLVDLQVNGFGGIDFSSPSLRPEQVDTVVERLEKEGTTVFCPTVVTTSWRTYEHVLPILADAIERHPKRLPGIHLEGPFISPKPGAVGAHPPDCVRPPNLSEWHRLWDLARGTVAVLTLAPEEDGSVAVIEDAVGKGVLVAMGHSLAGEHEIGTAVRAGLGMSTHLGNGCPEQIHRHHNPIIAQLGSPLAASIIADGHHLPPSFLRAVMAAKGPQSTVLVSDSVSLAGLAPGVYKLFGTEVELEESGRIRNLVSPGLAGSSSTLLQCANHAIQCCRLTEDDAWAMCRDNALRLLGRFGKSVAAGGPVAWDTESRQFRLDSALTSQPGEAGAKAHR